MLKEEKIQVSLPTIWREGIKKRLINTVEGEDGLRLANKTEKY